MPQPGEVVPAGKLKKGAPVEAPGNPEGMKPGPLTPAGIAAAVTEGLTNGIRSLLPTPERQRDLTVYAVAGLVALVALIAVLRR